MHRQDFRSSLSKGYEHRRWFSINLKKTVEYIDQGVKKTRLENVTALFNCRGADPAEVVDGPR